MNKFQVALLSTLLVANFNFLNAYAYELVGDEDEAGNSATLVTPMANSIKLAILAKDANALAKFMSYPIDLKVKDQEVHFDSKEDFINATKGIRRKCKRYFLLRICGVERRNAC